MDSEADEGVRDSKDDAAPVVCRLVESALMGRDDAGMACARDASSCSERISQLGAAAFEDALAAVVKWLGDGERCACSTAACGGAGAAPIGGCCCCCCVLGGGGSCGCVCGIGGSSCTQPTDGTMPIAPRSSHCHQPLHRMPGG